MSDLSGEFSFPTPVCFGAGCAARIFEGVLRLGMQRPLLVTDVQLATLPPVQTVRAGLAAAGVSFEVFCDLQGDPTESHVAAGLRAYRAGSHDGLIGVGGGAAMDAAKAIALASQVEGSLLDYAELPGRAPKAVQGVLPAVIAVPTTAGTGSEVGRSTVVAADATHIKHVICAPQLMPQQVYVDPLLTLQLPAALTAATGMDALTHAVEAYLAPGFQPLCDGIALQAVRYVARSLPRAVQFAQAPTRQDDPQHVVARAEMMAAALMGAVAFQKGLGVVHACAHALSAVCGVHHGLANALMLPHGLRLQPAVIAEKTRLLARLLEAPGDDFAAWVAALVERIGLPSSLQAVGVERQHVERLVKIAREDGCLASDPRGVSVQDLEGLFHAGLGG